MIALGLLAAGIWLLPSARRGAGLALALAAGSLALAFAAKVVGVDFMYYRPLLYAWIPAAIAAAAVLAAPRLGRAGVAAAVIVFAGLLACTIAIAARPTLHREDWRGVTGFIGPRDAQRAIYVRSWWPTSAFEYYRPTVRLPENGARVHELVEIGFGGLNLDVPPGWKLVERRPEPATSAPACALPGPCSSAEADLTRHVVGTPRTRRRPSCGRPSTASRTASTSLSALAARGVSQGRRQARGSGTHPPSVSRALFPGCLFDRLNEAGARGQRRRASQRCWYLAGTV